MHGRSKNDRRRAAAQIDKRMVAANRDSKSADRSEVVFPRRKHFFPSGIECCGLRIFLKLPKLSN